MRQKPGTAKPTAESMVKGIFVNPPAGGVPWVVSNASAICARAP